jgi:hypothetical protein
MKKLILCILAIGMISGCQDHSGSPTMSKKLDSSYVLDIYSMEGHKYITYINGGLVHAESCECKNKGYKK